LQYIVLPRLEHPRRSFTTVKPQAVVSGTLHVCDICDANTVGITAPFILQFDDHVADRAAVQRALQVRPSVPTEARGHQRPLPDALALQGLHAAQYAGHGHREAVRVNHGDGKWGQEDLNLHFTVGRPQIVKADVTSHRLVVVRDGQVVMDFPASYGLGSDPKRVTRSGTHVVMSKSPLYLMSNPAYGYVNFPHASRCGS
jgi:hypothetical protein